MRITAFLVAALAATLLAGCTTYHYSGRVEASDSSGNMREFLLYWRKTEYAFIYGVNEGPVSLITQCSLNNVLFEEREGGIVFRHRPDEDRFVNGPRHAANDTICGLVEGARNIENLNAGAGAVTIRIWCRPESNRSIRAYLMPRDEPYVFDIVREKTDEAPKKPDCPQG